MAFLSRPFAKDERAAKAARRKEGRDCVTAGWRILRESSEPITTAASDSLQFFNAMTIFQCSVNRGFVLSRCRRYNRAHLRLFHRSAQKLQLDNIVGNKNVSSLNAEPNGNGFCARSDSSRYLRNVVGLGDCVVMTWRGTARPLVMGLWVVLGCVDFVIIDNNIKADGIRLKRSTIPTSM